MSKKRAFATSAISTPAGSALEFRSVVFDALSGWSPIVSDTARLFYVMAIGSALVWLAASAIAWHASRSRRAKWSEHQGLRLIVIGGVITPVVALTALFAYGLPLLARHTDRPAPDLRMTIIGEQWWWRVRYELPGGGHVDLANEVRLPRGRVTHATLTSTNVIHAWWVPSLAGKMDMIPGRLTSLTLQPERAGVLHGVCAEYCGASHAKMAFAVEVMEPAAFDAWLTAQAQPAAAVDEAPAFIEDGCAACHTVRGTSADGTIGPDLTHVGSRRTLAAAALTNTEQDMVNWLAAPDRIKPGALMPPFAALGPERLQRLARYLLELR